MQTLQMNESFFALRQSVSYSFTLATLSMAASNLSTNLSKSA